MKYWPKSTETGRADPVQQAFDTLVALTASIDPVRTTDSEIIAAAQLEAQTGWVTIDQRGLTPGTLGVLLPGIRPPLARWVRAKTEFLAHLAAKRPDLEAMETLPEAIATLKRDRQADIDALRARWDDQPRHALIASQWEVAQNVYRRESEKHGQRLANMTAQTVWYWMGLLCIGIAEWLINYDTFLSFTGVVAIAVGATVILAIGLAFAAHGHGAILKQWPYRFGRFQTRQTRTDSWRLMALATFAVMVVLLAAGGSRYAAVMRGLNQTHQPDMLGGGYTLDINPVRDVLLSLLANIAAWIVGVFISYFCHDVDPEFMAATHQHRRGGRAYFKARHGLEEDIQVIIARTSKDVGGLENAAAVRYGSVRKERDMLAQIQQHEKALMERLAVDMQLQAQLYRRCLLETQSSLAEDLRAHPLSVEPGFIRSLMAGQ